MYICVPIRTRKTSTLLSAIKKSNKIADIIEIWFDELTDLSEKNLKTIVRVARKPLLYKVSKHDEKKLDLILSIGGISYLDLDLNTGQPLIEKIKTGHPGLKIIISHHNFSKTPPLKVLQGIAAKMLQKGADIIKISTKASGPSDSLTMLSLLSDLTANNKPAICLCMGKSGQLTRLTGHLLGNYLMYAPISSANQTAPGQITAGQLRKILALQS